MRKEQQEKLKNCVSQKPWLSRVSASEGQTGRTLDLTVVMTNLTIQVKIEINLFNPPATLKQALVLSQNVMQNLQVRSKG